MYVYIEVWYHFLVSSWEAIKRRRDKRFTFVNRAVSARDLCRHSCFVVIDLRASIIFVINCAHPGESPVGEQLTVSLHRWEWYRSVISLFLFLFLSLLWLLCLVSSENKWSLYTKGTPVYIERIFHAFLNVFNSFIIFFFL